MANSSSRRRGWSLGKLVFRLFLVVAALTFLGNPQWPVVGPAIQQLQTGVKYLQHQVGVRFAESTSTSAPPAPPPSDALPAQNPNVQTGTLNPVPAQNTGYQRPADKVYIASFNIQVFGESKLSKPDVVEILVQLVRQFDIVAIQEVRAQSDEILPRFLAAINANGARYQYLIGPRLGRTNSTEQYAFIYDSSRIEADPASVGTIADPNDLLHREPFVARFRPRTNNPDRAFTFWLVDMHTDPDEVKQEVDVLADVFQLMKGARPDEDDVILLGDLNASEKQLGRLGQLPGIGWVVSGVPTNTQKSKTYDNLIYDTSATREYTGRWGVVDIESIFGVSRDQALRVSDHLPVWAEFDVWEANLATNMAGSAALTR